jgi:hypothetical protein
MVMSNRSVQPIGRLTGVTVVVLLVAAATPSTHAAFHFWQMHEVFSNASGTVQFIEMQDLVGGEEFTGGFSMSANSDGNVQSVTLTDLTGSTPGYLLFATPGFAALPGGVTPDFPIPAHFFNPNATNLTFSFNGSGDSIAFGGAALPKNGINSLSDNNIYGVQNLASAANSPTNLNGDAGSVNVSPEPVTGLIPLIAWPLMSLRRRCRRR